jgi:hypothetical protein
MLKLALVAVAILLAPSASAQTLMITRSCAGGSCVTTIGPAGRGLGAVKSVPQPSDADVRELIEAREAKWVEFASLKCGRTHPRGTSGAIAMRTRDARMGGSSRPWRLIWTRSRKFTMRFASLAS